MYHYTQGKPTRQGHKGIPEGFFEEEQGLEGFFGPVSHLIKEKPSTRWTSIEGNLKPRMYDLVQHLAADTIAGDAARLTGQRLFYNADITISSLWVMPGTAPDQLESRRNADGDWMYFCHKGRGSVLSEYGLLDFTPGSYIVMPKCIGHTFFVTEPTQFLLIENRTSHFREPDRGIIGRHAPWDPNALVKPDLERLYQVMRQENIDVRTVRVKHTDEMTTLGYDACVYDVQGWKGDLFPYTLHMDHIMPIMSHRVHLPPSVHSTFVARGFVVCSFLPRPMEEEADALRVPFYHQNIDYDEILFYHDGDFFSRDNLHAGMMSFHPAGFPHGPHPKAMEKVKTKTHTDEKAVMIDTRWPLKRDEALPRFEVGDYWKSWMKK
ncbi:MAG: homogentisate 1,2-dioxygenase [Bdellovibrionales bacterium]|jgi:homogentisate 1,2-dioxygenase|nr:homogentisate 1,2-dioxygenase [Bdellovibrionales bacterium]